MNQSQSNSSDYIDRKRPHGFYIGEHCDSCDVAADQIVRCGTCGASLDADYDMFFEADNRTIVCVECWISASAEAVSV